MKYAWLPVMLIGIAGIYLGYQENQVDGTEFLGGYPCFLCASVEPDFEIVVFSSTSSEYERAVQKVLKFCRLTGASYGSAFYEGAEETLEKLEELGLEWNSGFLVVVLKNGEIIKTSTNADTVEQFLSQILKEASRI